MRSIFSVVVSMALWSIPAGAELEDGVGLCEDGIDNDLDGFIDCQEPACVSSLETCGYLPGPTRT